MEPVVAFTKQFIAEVKYLAAAKKQQPILRNFWKFLRALPNLRKVIHSGHHGHDE
jgi:hypothetical protein